MSYAGSWPNPFKYTTGGGAPYSGRPPPPISTLAVAVNSPPPAARVRVMAGIISGIFAATQTYQAAFAFVGGNAVLVPVSIASVSTDDPPHITIPIPIGDWRTVMPNSVYARRETPPLSVVAVPSYRPSPDTYVTAQIISGLFSSAQTYQAGFAFVGGSGPYEGRPPLPPSVVAVPENNPPYVTTLVPMTEYWRTVMPPNVYFSRGRRIPPPEMAVPVDEPPHATMQIPNVDTWRIAMPPTVYNSRGRRIPPDEMAVPVNDPPPIGLPSAFDAPFSAWRVPFLLPILPRPVPQGVINEAPLESAGLANMSLSWPAPDQTVALQTRPVLNPGLVLEVAPVDSPPIPTPPPWWSSVAASWLTPDQPDQSRRVPNPAFLNLVTDDPPVAPPLPRWWLSVYASWTQPIQPQLFTPDKLPVPSVPVIAPIAGQTASTYVPVAGDVGARIFVTVVATNAAGDSLPATSESTTLVVP